MDKLNSAAPSAAPNTKARRGQHRLVVVGVDGGGTSTGVAVLDAATQELLSQTVAGPSNWNSVGTEAAASTIRAAVLDALTAARCTAEGVVCICLGLAGVDDCDDEERVKAVVRGWLPTYAATCPPAQARIYVHNDAYVPLFYECDGLPGCVLIAGTGTIVVGCGPGANSARAGGWGPMFLDSGSGYDLGQQALAAIARATDGRGERSALEALVRSHCAVADNNDLLGWAYAQQGWAPIAALAPLVMAAAKSGDAVAARIIDTAADQAGGAVDAVVAKCGLAGMLYKIVLSGGLLSDPASAFSEAVRARLRDYYHSELVVPSVSAHYAAAVCAHRSYTRALWREDSLAREKERRLKEENG